MDQNEIIAHLQIRQCLARYCRGVDRRDAALIKSAYHPDAHDDHGAWAGNAHEFADWLVERMKGRKLVGQHHVTNVYIELSGDHARVESYYLAYHPILDPDTGEEVLLQDGGRYLDRFERRAGEWKILERRVLVDWARRELPGEDWEGRAAFPPVGPVGHDPSDSLFSN